MCLHYLQVQSKWQAKSRNSDVGDMVLLPEENQLRLHWLTGWVIKLSPEYDSVVLAVAVMCAKSTLKGPVRKVRLILI